MPVNATSTGATYGKSSDPLCPLGFHPQVRWPTRCKRCFRDYKEHMDDNDRVKYASLDSNSQDSWANNGRRQGFNKSKSLDVSLEGAASRRNAAQVAEKQEEKDINIPKGRKHNNILYRCALSKIT